MKTILIAEDDPAVRNNLKFILEKNQFKVYAAGNGMECLKMAADISPDLIISDIIMPVMDGIELLTKIRNGSVNSTVPFIFLTARTTYEEARLGMETGADDYLYKPFGIKELLKAVNASLQKYELHEKRLKELRDNIALTVPHEFRTPLTAILGYSEILKEEISNTLKDKGIDDIVSNLSDAARRFNNLVQKFTNYTNVVLMLDNESSVKSILKREIFSTGLLIQSSALKVAEQHKRLADLILNIEDTGLNYDETYLSFIIEELVNNAMRYSRCGKKVAIDAKAEEGSYNIRIKDNGTGMTADQIKNIDAFNQFKKDAFLGKSGNGIGLITVKKIAQRTGLNFLINSESGIYTEAVIGIPLSIINEN